MRRTFIAIPWAIWTMDLSTSEKVILAEVVSLHQQPAGCFASNRHFADLCRISVSAARKALTRLDERGLIRKDYADHRAYGGSDCQRLLCPLVTIGEERTDTPPAREVPANRTKKKTETKTVDRRKKGKPTGLDEVLEAFAEMGKPVEGENFWNYYEANGWVQGRAKKPIRDWKAAARQWIRNTEKFDNENRKRGYQKPNWDRETLQRWADQ